MAFPSCCTRAATSQAAKLPACTGLSPVPTAAWTRAPWLLTSLSRFCGVGGRQNRVLLSTPLETPELCLEPLGSHKFVPKESPVLCPPKSPGCPETPEATLPAGPQCHSLGGLLGAQPAGPAVCSGSGRRPVCLAGLRLLHPGHLSSGSLKNCKRQPWPPGLSSSRRLRHLQPWRGPGQVGTVVISIRATLPTHSVPLMEGRGKRWAGSRRARRMGTGRSTSEAAVGPALHIRGEGVAS